MVRKRKRADRERATDRDHADDEQERSADHVLDAGTPLGVPDATIPDATLPDAGLPDCSVPGAGFGDASIHIQRSEEYSQADPKPETTPTDVTFPDAQLQAKFKHARSFGVTGNWNMKNKEKFEEALQKHSTDSDTIIIDGEYRRESAIHYYNKQTNNVVITYPDGQFWSAWALTGDQRDHLLSTGELGGG